MSRRNYALSAVVVVPLIFVSSTCFAQLADSVTARRSQLQNSGRPGEPTETARYPAYGHGGWNHSGFDCPTAYQNRTNAPISLNISATMGHDSVTWLFVKRTWTSPWVTSGFVRDIGTTTSIIPPGAIYCVTSNSGGQFWANSLTNISLGAGWITPVTLYTSQNVTGEFYFINGDCYNIYFLRITYNDGVEVGRNYIGYTYNNSRSAAISTTNQNIMTGQCPIPPPPEGGGN